MARVRVVVSDGQKERWTNYVDETTEYDSLSDLVRKTVEQEIKSDDSESTAGQYQELYEIMETVESIKKQQSQIQDSIDAHRQNSINKSNLDELEDLILNSIWEYADMIREVDEEDRVDKADGESEDE